MRYLYIVLALLLCYGVSTSLAANDKVNSSIYDYQKNHEGSSINDQIEFLLKKKAFNSAINFLNSKVENCIVKDSIIYYKQLKASVYNSADLHKNAIEIYKDIYNSIEKDVNNDSLKWSTLYDILKYKTLINDYKENEYYLKQANNLLAKSNIPEWQADLFNIEAALLEKLKETDKALLKIDSAIYIYKHDRNYAKLWQSYRCKGDIFYSARNYDDALVFYRKALDVSKYTKEKCNNLEIEMNIATVLQMKGDDITAIANLKEILKTKDSANLDKTVISTAYHNLAIAYLNMYKFEECLTYMDSSLIYAKSSSNYNLLESVYAKKAKVHYHLKNYKKAFVYLYEKNKYTDSLDQEEITALISKMELRQGFEKDKLQSQNQELLVNELKKQSRIKLWMLAFFVTTNIITIILLLKTRNKFKVFAIKSIQNKRVVLNSKRNEIKLLKRELSTLKKDMQKAIFIFNEVFSIHNKLNKQLKQNDNNLLDKQDSIIDLNNAHRILKDSDLIVTGLEKEEVGIKNKIIKAYPSLSKNEVKLCILIRLEMTNKEIASYTNVAIGSVEVAKYRLRKKLGFSTMSEFVQELNQI